VHQKVTGLAKAGSTFYFTLAGHASVSLTSSGSALGGLALYGQLDEGVGEIVGLSGAGTTACSLGPGSYWITSSTGCTAKQDTQLSQFLNLGTTDASYAFTVSFAQSSGDGGGDGGGGGGD
jgi:hypothetical protein